LVLELERRSRMMVFEGERGRREVIYAVRIRMSTLGWINRDI
jgi:hypothetical protein